MAADLKSSDAGEPRKALALKFVYRMDVRGATKAYTAPHDARVSKPGKGATAQPSRKPKPNKGELKSIPSSDTSHWVHPASARALIAYADDSILTGHTASARALLTAHLPAVKAAGGRAGAGLEWVSLHAELTALIQRLEGPYDYFGNPAGWVPMLSFQANHKLYKNELGVAVRTMFLAYWVENQQTRTQKAYDVLVEAMERLRRETQQAIETYEAAQTKLVTLDKRSADIKKELGDRTKDLEDLVKRLKQETKDNLKVEHFWRSAAKIVGGVMQLVPVGQPVLGAVGKSLTVISDIDLDDPSGVIGDLGGAWSTVLEEKVAPKFSNLLSGLKSAKEDEEKAPVEKKKTEAETEAEKKKADFEKEVAKKKLDEKVKKHMEEQKKAKDDLFTGFSGFAVSEDDIKERLAQVVAKSPDFKTLAGQIEELNKSKAAFAEELFAALGAIDQSAATIVNNQQALIEMRAQVNRTLDKLNVEALQYVQGMGQRARHRLLVYQYYLLKSYHYLTLEGLPELDFRTQKMFDTFAALLPESTGGMLTDAQYQSLGVVFEDELRDIAKKIIDFYQTHKGRVTGDFTIQLTKDQLETLNARPHRIEVDLLWRLNTAREDIRITRIETESVRLAAPLPTRVVNIGLEYRHDGLSRLRRGGKLFLFRSGEYRVGGSGSSGDTRSDAIYWAADVTFNPKPPDGQPKLKWTDAKEDTEADSLVRELIGDKGKDGPLVSFRPSAWTNLAIKRTGDFAGKLDDLTLKVHYVYYRVKDDLLSTVVVKVAGDAQPLIRCDKPDVNKRDDGQGSFVRTFNHTERRNVTLTAPARYGQRGFQGWRVAENTAGNDDESLPLDPSELKRDRSLTLDVRAAQDHLVEPVYEPTEFVPINDKDEEWPACPTGWNFDDWVFVNRTKSELTLQEIYIPNPPQRQSLAVNTPQGTGLVQLSFERLKLLPGESTKLSVCINPDGSGLANILNVAFIWRARDEYAVGFDATGRLLVLWRGLGDNRWVDTPASFDLDAENRIIAFARP